MFTERGLFLPVLFCIYPGLTGFTTLKERIKSMNDINLNRLLSRKEAADYLGVKEVTLAIWKSTKRHGLPVVKVGRLAKYRYGDLLEFVERQTVNKPTDRTNDH